jgi:endonuclease/exonuclease/phosphatase family metal-dependent hydrolase
MKKNYFALITFSIFFLFLIQLAGSLVESIYILDLMNTSLDEKALGVLFFFTPLLLLSFRKKLPVLVPWVLCGLLLLARGFLPYLDTLGRMLSSGIGAGAALSLLPFLLTARGKGHPGSSASSWASSGLALAIGLSVLLRTLGFGLDYSLVPEGGWVGWALAGVLGFLLTLLDWQVQDSTRTRSGPVALDVFGILLIIGLAWFAFSAPSVISRWTEGGFRLITMGVSLLSVVWVGVALVRPRWLNRVPSAGLLAWNLAFTLSLLLTILAHRVPFPQAPDAAPVVVGSPTPLQALPLVLSLLLFPVIFYDLQFFSRRLQQADPSPRDLVPGTLLGSLALVLLVFFHIFSNVWGYIEPVSPWFRNKFWLPYLLLAGLVTVLSGRKRASIGDDQPDTANPFSWGWGAFLAALFLATAAGSFYTTRIQPFEPRQGAIVVMTYNIQGANDDAGERSYRQQLALIRQVNPDILALQESDTSRISLNNNDFVRYYAGKLGYYSYYGPTTVAGTFGTAILSRYPLQNTRSVYTFSDQDEIGTAEAEVEIGGQHFTIYNVHPDGSDTAMQVWAETLLARSQGKSNVIALGDYNLRDYEEAYLLVASRYTNAWVSVYPSKISPDGTDMTGDNRIDHIFFSSTLMARDPVYILPPESATDHPLHWATISWEE